MPIFQDFKPFRDAIDAKDIQKIQAFITDHPDWDYNNIAPNGASALWWALTSSAVSIAVLKFLLSYIKNDGSALVSPVQQFMGRRPVDFIENDFDIRMLILRYENRYVAPPQVEGGLAGVLRNAHNVHDPMVNKLVQQNVAKIYQHYKDCPSSEKEIQKYIELLTKEKSDHFTDHELDSIKQSLTRCLRLSDTREVTIIDDVTVNLTLTELLRLVWAAANDQDPKMLPLECKAEDSVNEKRLALLQSLFEAQNAYGENNPSCWLGTFNRIALALMARHKLVLSSVTGMKLTGEIARLKMTSNIARCLVGLGDDEKTREQYYGVLLEEIDPELEPNTQLQFIKNHYGKLLESSIENDQVDKEQANAFFNEIKETIPLNAHRETHHILILSDYLKKKKQFNINQIIRFTPQDALTFLIDRISSLIPMEAQWIASVKSLRLEPTAQTAKLFIQNWLAISLDTNQMPKLSFEDLNKKIPASDAVLTNLEKQKQQRSIDAQNTKNAAILNCLFNAAWDVQKPMLKVRHPEQIAWIDGLTRYEIHQLFAEENIQAPISVKMFGFLIAKGLKLGITRGLNLKGLTFTDADFRGFDFSGADLSNTVFRNCDLRLVATNGKTKAVGCKVDASCHVETKPIDYLDGILHYMFIGTDLRILNTYAEGNYLFGILKVLSTPSTSEIIKIKNDMLHYGVIKAAEMGYLESLNAMLSWPQCTQETLKKNRGSYSALFSAATNGHVGCVEAILASPHFSAELFQLQGFRDRFPLHAAVRRGHVHCVKALLASPLCTLSILELTDENCETILELAVRYKRADCVNAILASPHFGIKFLNKKDSAGYTILMKAAADGNVDIVQAFLALPYFSRDIFTMVNNYGVSALMKASGLCFKALLESPYCTAEDLKVKNRDGRTALMLAIINRRYGNVTLILTSDKFTPELLTMQDEYGDTALSLANLDGKKLLLQSPRYTAEVLRRNNEFSYVVDADMTTHISAIRDVPIKYLLQLASLNKVFVSPEEQQDLEYLKLLQEYSVTGFKKIFLSGKWNSNHTVFAEKLFNKIKELGFNDFQTARRNGEWQLELNQYLQGLPKDGMSLKSEFAGICKGLGLKVRCYDNDNDDVLAQQQEPRAV